MHRDVANIRQLFYNLFEIGSQEAAMKRFLGFVKYFLLPLTAIIILFRLGILFGILGIIAYFALVWFLFKPSYYRYQGTAAYSKGDIDTALVFFKMAVDTKRASHNTITSYGYLLLKAGRVEEAEAVLEKELAAKRSREEMLHTKSNLALVIWKKGDLDAAINMMEEIMKEYKNTSIYGSLGYLYILKGDLEKALQFNLEAYDYNSENTIIMDNLGQNYYLLGDNDKSAEIYEKLMTLNPSFPEAYYNYGLVLERNNEKEKALEIMKKSLDFKFTYLSTVEKEVIEKHIAELEETLANPQ